MILFDISGTIYAAIHVELSNSESKLSEDFIRHVILNNIRQFNVLHRKKYGQMVICMDSTSWRNDVFEFYKYERKVKRELDEEENRIEWEEIFLVVEKIMKEIKENFTFPVIRVDGCEADDVMYVLNDHIKEKNLIVSNDKDMLQLSSYRTQCWMPRTFRRNNNINEAFLIEEDPQFNLFSLIIKGDKSDGIPSILCNDDFHKNRVDGISSKRSPAITTKKLNDLWDKFNDKNVSFKDVLLSIGKDVPNNFRRNYKLINLKQLPMQLHKNVINAWDNRRENEFKDMLNYLHSRKMRRTIESINDFNTL